MEICLQKLLIFCQYFVKDEFSVIQKVHDFSLIHSIIYLCNNIQWLRLGLNWSPGSENPVHSVRGQSGFFDLAMTERNMQVRFDLKLSVYLLGVDI